MTIKIQLELLAERSIELHLSVFCAKRFDCAARQIGSKLNEFYGILSRGYVDNQK